jgi:hypothetical protein
MIRARHISGKSGETTGGKAVSRAYSLTRTFGSSEVATDSREENA